MRIVTLTSHYIKDISTLCVDSFLDGEYSYYLQMKNLKGLDSFVDFCSVANITEKFDDRHIFLGAFEENTLVGVCCINLKIGNILLLFVDKDYQNQGVGKALLSKAEETAKERNLKKLTVDSTHFGIGFYKANGYKEISKEQILNEGLIFTTMSKSI